jgi:hypothetical protein
VIALAAGTRIDSYQIVVQVGAGGMGEMYHAHDTKLGGGGMLWSTAGEIRIRNRKDFR